MFSYNDEEELELTATVMQAYHAFMSIIVASDLAIGIDEDGTVAVASENYQVDMNYENQAKIIREFTNLPEHIQEKILNSEVEVIVNEDL